MKQLGIYEDDEAEQHAEAPSTEVKGQYGSSDDDLLSQFEDMDLDQFKG